MMHRQQSVGLRFAAAFLPILLVAVPSGAQPREHAAVRLSEHVSERAAVRLLEQTTFGPTPELVAHVRQVGFDKFLSEQFALAPSAWRDPVPGGNGKTSWSPTQQYFFAIAVNGEDQLRQRVAWSLLQIWVVSGVKLNKPEMEVPYLRMLAADAFTSYRQIMHDVTLSPAMGHYLDMVNNNKPTQGHSADENYAREVMQLFTLGLEQLHLDGTPVLDASHQPIPTYGQDAIEGFANVFTGWTYAPAAGATSKWTNPPNWNEPMVAFEAHHDTGAKTLLNGAVAPAGQSAEQDLNMAFDVIISHANLAPFVSRQLIQHLVTGDPDPAYVQRVATVFESSKGDMKEVVRAIVLDPAARQGDGDSSPADFGALREPVLFISNTLRALGSTVEAVNSLPSYSSRMGQTVFFPASVFNYYAPSYDIAGTTLNAPAFQLLSPSTAITRADFINGLVYGNIDGVTYPIDAFTTAAANPPALLERLNTLFLHGTMGPEMTASVYAAMQAQPNQKAAAQAALYVVASSQQYQVQQ